MDPSQSISGQPTCLVLVRDPADSQNPDPAWSREILDGIKPIGAAYNLRVQIVDPRELGIGDHDSEIFRLLQRADLVIVDVHAGSGDYMYLLGARHALTNRPTLILNRVKNMPFDIRPGPESAILGESAQQILATLRDSLPLLLRSDSWQDVSYSLVRKALEDAPRIFLSYAHADRESVVAVDQWLRDRGARVDIDERNFIAGQDIRDEIARLVSQAGKIVCFYSKSSEDRYYTRLERRIVEEREESLYEAASPRPLLLFFRLDDTRLPTTSSHRLAINAWQMGFEAACHQLWRHILEQSAEPHRIDLARYREKAPWAR